MKQRGQWGQTQVGPWEPMMVDVGPLEGGSLWYVQKTSIAGALWQF